MLAIEPQNGLLLCVHLSLAWKRLHNVTGTPTYRYDIRTEQAHSFDRDIWVDKFLSPSQYRLRYRCISANKPILSCSDDNESWFDALMSCSLIVKLPTPARQLESSEQRAGQYALEYGAQGLGYYGEADLVKVSQLNSLWTKTEPIKTRRLNSCT